MAVSIRRSPQPFQGFVFALGLAAAGWIVAEATLGDAGANAAMLVFGCALLLVGVSLVLNVNRCADYMTDAMRKGAPYGFDFFRYALAEGRSGVRLPGVLVAIMGIAVAGYAVASLAS
jgi:predicted phage tail protein